MERNYETEGSTERKLNTERTTTTETNNEKFILTSREERIRNMDIPSQRNRGAMSEMKNYTEDQLINNKRDKKVNNYFRLRNRKYLHSYTSLKEFNLIKQSITPKLIK